MVRSGAEGVEIWEDGTPGQTEGEFFGLNFPPLSLIVKTFFGQWSSRKTVLLLTVRLPFSTAYIHFLLSSVSVGKRYTDSFLPGSSVLIFSLS